MLTQENNQHITSSKSSRESETDQPLSNIRLHPKVTPLPDNLLDLTKTSN